VFFIFVVSNLGGLLTPLGDPPLFLGFLRGVDFFWTIHLLPHWAVGVGCALGLFFVWDAWTILREPESVFTHPSAGASGFAVRGFINVLLLAGIVAGVLLQSQEFADAAQAWLNQYFACPALKLYTAREAFDRWRPGQELPRWGGGVLLIASLLSLLLTPRAARQGNEFAWGPIIEVAVLFFGIFVAMVPALALLDQRGRELGIAEPWQYFWLTGSLSSFLDNAPTYLTFATIAAEGKSLSDFSLVNGQPNVLLQAISVGAVFMGANTYVGNGPNFMVKAIADEAGYPTPSFFGYLLYAILLLGPVYVLVTWLFFWP
jgi:Na+/H+ antiporter NhaD/arsenite permease-like protein